MGHIGRWVDGSFPVASPMPSELFRDLPALGIIGSPPVPSFPVLISEGAGQATKQTRTC